MTKRRKMTQRQALEALGRVSGIARDVGHMIPELYRRTEQDATPDGYPRGASESGIRSKGDQADPTGSAALAVPPRDVVEGHVDSVLRHLTDALESVVHMGNAAAAALDVGDRERGRQSQAPECVNPACRALVLGKRRAGRCDACYEFRRTHDGADRPRELVERKESA